MKRLAKKISSDINRYLMPTTMMQCRYPTQLVDKFKAFCDEHDKTHSKVLIRALSDYLKSQGAIDKADDSFLEPKQLPKSE